MRFGVVQQTQSQPTDSQIYQTQLNHFAKVTLEQAEIWSCTTVWAHQRAAPQGRQSCLLLC